MSRAIRPLTVRVEDGPGRGPTVALARALCKEWPSDARLRRVEAGAVDCTDGSVVVTLRSSSVVRETISVDFGVPAEGDVDTAALLGGSATAWEGSDAWESWLGLYRAGALRCISGMPRLDLRWAVIEDDVAVPEEILGGGWQIHRLAPLGSGLARGEVRWGRRLASISLLLGRAELVVARPGPLAYDALRGDVPRTFLSTGEGWTELRREDVGDYPRIRQDLANSLSPSMLRSPVAKDAILERLRRIEAGAGRVAPLMNPEQVVSARAHVERMDSRFNPRLRRFGRKARKLLRDPEAFFTDSNHRLLHGIGKMLGSRNSRASRRLKGRWVD